MTRNNLPLRVGDTAYGITWRGVRHTVLKGVVSEIYYADQNMTPCAVLRGITRGPIGVKVFRTRSEAEAALQKKE